MSSSEGFISIDDSETKMLVRFLWILSVLGVLFVAEIVLCVFYELRARPNRHTPASRPLRAPQLTGQSDSDRPASGT